MISRSLVSILDNLQERNQRAFENVENSGQSPIIFYVQCIEEAPMSDGFFFLLVRFEVGEGRFNAFLFLIYIYIFITQKSQQIRTNIK